MVAVVTQEQSRMRYPAVRYVGSTTEVQIAYFPGSGGIDEYHLIVRPTAYADFATQARWVREAYQEACAQFALTCDTGVFHRFFCSDLPNQAPLITTEFREMEASSAVSWVSQPPAPPAKIALWAYHVQTPGATLVKRKEGATLSLKRGELTHYWTTGLTCPEEDYSRQQTEHILTRYEEDLQARGLTVADHVLRTWFFVQNVDANYQGLVTARREFFADRGLTPDTHYIASTGIEGRSAQVAAKVMMDAYAVAGVRREQIHYLSAPDHLCPTHHYGVTFERGVSVTYADRKQLFISGTASIDRTGNILHPGDVRRQLARTLENIAALLQQDGATLADVGVFLVYLRDPSDFDLVQHLMAEHSHGAPVQIVLAPVCRPGWLIEVECAAVVPAVNALLPPF